MNESERKVFTFILLFFILRTSSYLVIHIKNKYIPTVAVNKARMGISRMQKKKHKKSFSFFYSATQAEPEKYGNNK